MSFNANENAKRFMGFAKVYDDVRPKMPKYVTEIITKYLNHKPNIVVDLGCGTSLSTLAWQGYCNKIIGIEPSGDMLKIAMEKVTDDISFIKAFANNTGLENEVADVVVCSQSFHWMEPTETLYEINRILKSGGIFATVDCDWPPVCNFEAELAYNELLNNVKVLNSQDENGNNAHQWDKNMHLSNMQKSGYFKYCREIVFCNREQGSAQRLINLAKSQGGLQSLLKTNSSAIISKIDVFEKKIESILGESFNIDFCYRMRIGVKV